MSHIIAQQEPRSLGDAGAGAVANFLSPQSLDEDSDMQDDAAEIEFLNEILGELYDDANGFGFQLEYYQQLSVPDDATKLEFLDMSLEELYEAVHALELASQEPDLEQIKLISRVYYLIFSNTGSLNDIQKAIDAAEDSVAALNFDSPDYATCLKNLIVMLMNKYEGTLSFTDLDRAILRAEEMIGIKSLTDSDRKLAEADLSKMKSTRALWKGSIQGSNEEVFMAEEEMSIAEDFDVVKFAGHV